jgi:surface antigen
MQQITRFAPLFAALLLAGCSTSPSTDMQSQPTPIQATPGTLVAPMVAQPTTPIVVADNAETAGDASAYIDAGAYAKLSAGERADASAATFNALKFSRPGAPRAWGKSGGAAGTVTVGPLVKVNDTTCRNFTTVVTISGAAFTKNGTACQDPVSLGWTVSA